MSPVAAPCAAVDEVFAGNGPGRIVTKQYWQSLSTTGIVAFANSFRSAIKVYAMLWRSRYLERMLWEQQSPYRMSRCVIELMLYSLESQCRTSDVGVK